MNDGMIPKILTIIVITTGNKNQVKKPKKIIITNKML